MFIPRFLSDSIGPVAGAETQDFKMKTSRDSELEKESHLKLYAVSRAKFVHEFSQDLD